jgi:solute carrier family 25 protein 34/35
MPEVLKTRLQLQGELQRADSNAPRVYKNVGDVLVKTWRNEGIKGLQRGLFPAVSGSSSPGRTMQVCQG